MTPTPIYPKYTLEFARESYASKISRSSQIIYIVFILAILIFGGCLPFFNINISVKSQALIRPASQIHLAEVATKLFNQGKNNPSKVFSLM